MTVNTNPMNWWKTLEISLPLKEALFSLLNFRGGGGVRTSLPKYYGIGLETICDIKNRETKLIKL
jgi:hypothetical protein